MRMSRLSCEWSYIRMNSMRMKAACEWTPDECGFTRMNSHSREWTFFRATEASFVRMSHTFACDGSAAVFLTNLIQKSWFWHPNDAKLSRNQLYKLLNRFQSLKHQIFTIFRNRTRVQKLLKEMNQNLNSKLVLDQIDMYKQLITYRERSGTVEIRRRGAECVRIEDRSLCRFSYGFRENSFFL